MELLGQGTRFVIVGGLLAFLLVAGIWRLSGRDVSPSGVSAIGGSPQAAPDRPPIDLAAPANTETATFALG